MHPLMCLDDGRAAKPRFQSVGPWSIVGSRCGSGEASLCPYTSRVDWYPNKQPSERRRVQDEAMFKVELGLREEVMVEPLLVYDEEQELLRFRDCRFAFSRRYANEWVSILRPQPSCTPHSRKP